jgi:hypothetical protein
MVTIFFSLFISRVSWLDQYFFLLLRFNCTSSFLSQFICASSFLSQFICSLYLLTSGFMCKRMILVSKKRSECRAIFLTSCRIYDGISGGRLRYIQIKRKYCLCIIFTIEYLTLHCNLKTGWVDAIERFSRVIPSKQTLPHINLACDLILG